MLIIRPNGGERVKGRFELQWSANDPDGDALTFQISYSPNNGQTWTQIANGVSGITYIWDSTTVAAGSTYLIKIEASDGTHNAEDVSDASFTVELEAAVTTSSPGDGFFAPGFKIGEVLGAILVLTLLSLIRHRKRRISRD